MLMQIQPVDRPCSPAALRSLAVARVVFTGLVLGIILTASLAPFRIQMPAGNGIHVPGRLGFPHSSFRDLSMNVAAYLPVGMVLAWGAWQRRSRRARWMPLCVVAVATLGGGLFSFLNEWMQTMLPHRYASWIDVAANTAGTLLGAAAWVWVFYPGAHATRTARRNGAAVRASLLAAAFVTDAPVNVARMIRELAGDLRRADLAPAVAEASQALCRAAASIADLLLNRGVGQALAFGALGFFLARGRTGSIPATWARGAALAFAAETMQLFTTQHHFELADLARNITAVALGAAAHWLSTTAFEIAPAAMLDLRAPRN